MQRFVLLVLVSLSGLGLTGPPARGERQSPQRVTLDIRENGQPVPCRVHLKDEKGQPVGAPGLPYWRDHFVCPGSVSLDLPPGRYTYEVERGPEYRPATGEFTVPLAGEAKLRATLKRLLDTAADGWWSGELHVHRPVTDIELLMRAEDLHAATLITWWNNQNLWANKDLPTEPVVRFDANRAYEVMGGEDEREGGALLFSHLNRPLALSGSSREYPSPLKFVEQVKQQPGGWVDIEKPFWWDVPVWLASGQVDSIGLANNHMCRSEMYASEAWGKPRDTARLPAPLGNGLWTQEIYYQILNAGLRVPPSAGSASGVLPNPVGYNRVYVHLQGGFTWDGWWAGLRAGRSFVTNGPLLRVTATRGGGQPSLPGTVFSAEGKTDVTLALRGSLTSRDPIRVIEVVRDGKVVRSLTPAELERAGSLGSLTFEESGWFLIRALADNPKTFRFASTAPFYVEVGSVARPIHRSAARFFLDWARERMARVKLENPAQLEEVNRYHREAIAFWEKRLEAATME